MSSRRFPQSLLLISALALLAAGVALNAQAPDERFKADILLVVAHPDDDTLAGPYLARAIYEQKKRVAVVFMTSGESGGNQQGTEHGPSLGLIRQIEGRRDLMTLGITNVWFLDGRDTPGQDPRRSLGVWGHGRAIADLVRVMRLTRPDVVLTWMPFQVQGENHGDHQAAGVVATEAFDLAASDTAFAEQLAAPVRDFESEFEGLRPWQPSKLYFMSDSLDTTFMDGHGPFFPLTAQSPAKNKPYWQFAYEQLREHRTQYKAQLDYMAAGTEEQRRAVMMEPGEGQIDPLRLVLGKSLVAASLTGDPFEGVGTPQRNVRSTAMPAEPAAERPLALGGPWHFYTRFWTTHDLRELPRLALQPIGPIDAGGRVRIPLRVTNTDTRDARVKITAVLPAGWKEEPREEVTIAPHDAREVASEVTVAPDAPEGVVRISYDLAGLGAASHLEVAISVRHGAVPLP